VPIGMGLIRNKVMISWLHKRTGRIYEEAALIVTLSEGMQEQVLSHGVPKDKTRVIHNGTDPASFRCLPRADADTIVVLYAGTVGKANDLTQLLAAVKSLEEQGIGNLRFRIMGGGNDLDRVKAEADGLNLSCVEFLPSVPKENIQAEFQKAHIGLVCFGAWKVLEANSANKFYDYLAAGLPVVINYQGWQARYLEEYGCGLSAPQGDAHALATQLKVLARDPDLRRKMGEKGVLLATEKFDRKKLADAVLREFLDITKA
jgi:glycosyltransferase involved in cell wall biosynthesis